MKTTISGKFLLVVVLIIGIFAGMALPVGAVEDTTVNVTVSNTTEVLVSEDHAGVPGTGTGTELPMSAIPEATATSTSTQPVPEATTNVSVTGTEFSTSAAPETPVAGTSTQVPITVTPPSVQVTEIPDESLVHETFESSLAESGPGYFSAAERAMQSERSLVSTVSPASQDVTPLWSSSIWGNFSSAPAIADGIAYISSNDGDSSTYALDLHTGHMTEHFMGTGQSGRGGPTVDNGMVFVGSSNHLVYGYSTADGPLAMKWWFSTGSSVASRPFVMNGVVYFSDNNKIYALTAGTGKEQWSYDSCGPYCSAPQGANGVVYFSDNDKIYARNAITGDEIQTVSTNDPSIRPHTTSPVVVNGVLYFGSGHNLYAFDATSGQKKWTYNTIGEIYYPPTVANGVVYVGSDPHDFHAVNANSGQKIWTLTQKFASYSSFAVADGVAYFGNGHDLYAVNAADGHKIWNYTAGNSWVGSPAIADGILVVGTDPGPVYAFDVSRREVSRTWIINTTPPTPSDTFPIYSGNAPYISDEILEGIIQSFNPYTDTGITMGDGAGFRSAVSADKKIEVTTYKGSGAIIAHDNRIWAKTDQYAGVPPLPSPVAAISVSSYYINSTMVFIQSEGSEPDFGNPRVSYYNKIVNESQILWQDATVSFERPLLFGYPVIGDVLSTEVAADPSTKGNWKVVSWYSNWRDWKKTRNSVKSIPFGSTGFERFKQVGVVPVNLNHLENASNITIYADSVTLAWFSPPAAVISDVYLQPVYIVSGHIVVDGITDSYFPAYIPATDRILVNIPPLKAEAISEPSFEASRTTGFSVSSADVVSSEEQSVKRESSQKSDATYTLYIAAPMDYKYQSDLSGSENNVKGFRDNLTSRSTEWTTSNTDLKKDALPKKWKSKDKDGGEDDKYADKADLAYFDGHGKYGELVFSHGGSIVDELSYLGHDDMLFGDTNVKWVVLDACWALNKSHSDWTSSWKWEDWKSSFKGLHMLLGFDTDSGAYDTRGYTFANRLAGVTQGSKKGNVSIRQAWKDAIALSEPNLKDSRGGGIVWVKPCGEEKLAGFTSDSLCTPDDPKDFVYENWRVT